MIDIRDAKFTAIQTAEAAGVKLATMQTWLARYEKPKENTVGGGVQGRARVFNFYNVLSIATAAKLIEAKLATETALFAGETFAHSAMPFLGYDRHPGMLYHSPNGKVQTLLCVSTKGTCEVPVADGIDPLKEVRILLGYPPVITTMLMDELWINVCWKLGFPPNEVINAVYGAMAD